MKDDLGTYLVPMRVTNPETKVSKVTWCIFDSGFTGYLSLDERTMRDLNLNRAGKGRAHTVTGNVDYETFFGIAEIIDENQKTIVTLQQDERMVLHEPGIEVGIGHTDPAIIPIQQFRHSLFGMQSIQQFSWLIVAEKKMLCLVEV
jgi:predicted aspartyl protease